MYPRRRNHETVRLKRSGRKSKTSVALDTIFGPYFKLLLIWASVLALDFFTDFRFEFIWFCWLMIRTVSDSFRYQGLAFALFFTLFALIADLVSYLLVPTNIIYLLGSSCVWLQLAWQADRGVYIPTVALCFLFVYVEVTVRLRGPKNFPFGTDICRPFAAHCIGYPVVTMGFSLKAMVAHHFRMVTQRSVEAQNMTFFTLLEEALPKELRYYLKSENGSCKSAHPLNNSSGICATLNSSPVAENANSILHSHDSLPLMKQKSLTINHQPLNRKPNHASNEREHKSPLDLAPQTQASSADFGDGLNSCWTKDHRHNGPVLSGRFTNTSVPDLAQEIEIPGDHEHSVIVTQLYPECTTSSPDSTNLWLNSSSSCSNIYVTNCSDNGINHPVSDDKHHKIQTTNVPSMISTTSTSSSGSSSSSSSCVLSLPKSISPSLSTNISHHDTDGNKNCTINVNNNNNDNDNDNNNNNNNNNNANNVTNLSNSNKSCSKTKSTGCCKSNQSNKQLKKNQKSIFSSVSGNVIGKPSTPHSTDDLPNTCKSSSKNSNKDEYTLKLEADARRLKLEVQSLRSLEVQLRGQVQQLMAAERAYRSESSQAQQESETLQSKLNQLTQRLQTDRANLQAAENRLCEERKQRLSLEQKLFARQQQKKKKSADESVLIDAISSSNGNSETTCIKKTSAISRSTSPAVIDFNELPCCKNDELCAIRLHELEIEYISLMGASSTKNKQLALNNTKSAPSGVILSKPACSKRSNVIQFEQDNLKSRSSKHDASTSENSLTDLASRLACLCEENQRLTDTLKEEDKMKQELMTAYHSSLKEITELNATLTKKEYQIVELNMRLDYLTSHLFEYINMLNSSQTSVSGVQAQNQSNFSVSSLAGAPDSTNHNDINSYPLSLDPAPFYLPTCASITPKSQRSDSDYNRSHMTALSSSHQPYSSLCVSDHSTTINNFQQSCLAGKRILPPANDHLSYSYRNGNLTNCNNAGFSSVHYTNDPVSNGNLICGTKQDYSIENSLYGNSGHFTHNYSRQPKSYHHSHAYSQPGIIIPRARQQKCPVTVNQFVTHRSEKPLTLPSSLSGISLPLCSSNRPLPIGSPAPAPSPVPPGLLQNDLLQLTSAHIVDNGSNVTMSSLSSLEVAVQSSNAEASSVSPFGKAGVSVFGSSAFSDSSPFNSLTLEQQADVISSLSDSGNDPSRHLRSLGISLPLSSVTSNTKTVVETPSICQKLSFKAKTLDGLNLMTSVSTTANSSHVVSTNSNTCHAHCVFSSFNVNNTPKNNQNTVLHTNSDGLGHSSSANSSTN